MDDYFYIEFYSDNMDNKKVITGAELYNSDKLLKSFSKDQIKFIRKEIKDNKIEIKSNRGHDYVDNQLFVKYIDRKTTPQKKRYYIPKSLIGIVVGGTILTLLGTTKKLNNNTEMNNNAIVKAASIDKEEKKEITTETPTEKNTTEITTELPTTEEVTTEITTEITTEAPTEEITTEESTVKENIDKPLVTEETTIIEGFDDIFEFAYEDRSSNENVDTVDMNYSDIINKYSKRYGIDSKLMSAIICQENPNNIKNYSMYAGHGVPQVEGIHNSEVIYTFNYESNQIDSSGPIDVMKCVDDQDYSIKISCMILANQYNYIHETYGHKLSKEEELIASVWSYNKGITAIDEALRNTNSFKEFRDYVINYSYGGDNEYPEHVCSYIPDQEIITMKTNDGLLNSVMIDNTTVENTKKQL